MQRVMEAAGAGALVHQNSTASSKIIYILFNNVSELKLNIVFLCFMIIVAKR